MGLSIVTYALAKKYAKGKIDAAVEKALQDAKAYTDSKIAEIINFNIVIVDKLPPLSEADNHTIYFLPRTSPSGEADYYYEYMVIENQWEVIGSTELDLSNYWTIDETKAYIESKTYVLPIASTSTLGGVKVDGTSIEADNEGTISIINSYVENLSQDLIDDNFIKISSKEIDDLFSKNTK